MRPSLTGPITAMWFSGTRILPVAGITPAIDCCVTISVTIAPLCGVAGDGELFATAVVAGGFLLHPARSTIALRSVIKKVVCSVLIMLAPSVQRRCGRELEIEQRHLVIEKCLVKAGQRVAACADRIEQIERRTFAGLQRDLRLVLNVVHFRNHSGSIKVDAMLLLLERDEGFVYVAHHLIRKQLFLVLCLLLLDEGFGSLALIAIRYGKLDADAEGVAAGARRNLLDAARQREIGNALRVLQADVRVRGVFAELRCF